MDWTMIAHADDALHRIHALAYLPIERYQAEASDAGRTLANREEKNELRDQTISELRAYLADPSTDLAYVKFRSDREVREYLTEFLNVYDQYIQTHGHTEARST